MDKTKIQVTGMFFDEAELNAVVDVMRSGWISQGKKVSQFEHLFEEYLGRKWAIAVNSGSSALLLMFNSLIQSGYLAPGDEVITSALTWPTSVSAIIQSGLVPVFSDINLTEGSFLNMNTTQIHELMTDKTKAVLTGNFLGMPDDIDSINDSELLIIEDACDALGSEYKDRKIGSIGLTSAFSFFVAHHITTGEGGMITTDDDKINSICRSLRSFGRACICPTCISQNDYCPVFKASKSIDVRYRFNHLGYSMKMTDILASIGIEQMNKLEKFHNIRRTNAKLLTDNLSKYDSIIIPTFNEINSWFAFPIVVKKNAPFSRNELVNHLEKNGIETRMLLSGNITKQPFMKTTKYRKTSLSMADLAAENGFFIGCWHGLTEELMQYQIEKLVNFLDDHDY